jgi:hypothetical protein
MSTVMKTEEAQSELSVRHVEPIPPSDSQRHSIFYWFRRLRLRLGPRMMIGCLAALIAALLILASPTVGTWGMVAAIVIGSISAFLLKPQRHPASGK